MASFAEGFAQGKGQAQERSLIEDFRKSQKKLLDAQVDAAQNKLDAQRLLGSQAQGLEFPTTTAGEQAMGPPAQVPQKSLVDLLTSPENAGLALQAGVPVGAIAELQKNQQMQNLMQNLIPGMSQGEGGLQPDVSMTMGPGGVQLSTRPPSLTTQTIQTDEGPRIKTFAQTTQGAREIADLGPAKEDKITAEQAGRITALATAEKNANDIRDAIMGEQSFAAQKTLLLNMAAKTPGTEGRKLRFKMQDAADAVIRARTGATANEEEMKGIIEQFMPSPLDSAEGIQDKLNRFDAFISGSLEAITLPPSLRDKIQKTRGKQVQKEVSQGTSKIIDFSELP